MMKVDISNKRGQVLIMKGATSLRRFCWLQAKSVQTANGSRVLSFAGLHLRELGAEKLPAKVGNVNAGAIRTGLTW